MKVQRGAAAGRAPAQRQLPRQALHRQSDTINPALTPTASPRTVGSVEVGKLADLVLEAGLLRRQTLLILKGGMIAMAAMGDANASIPTPQPVHYRPMFAGLPCARPRDTALWLLAAWWSCLSGARSSNASGR